MNIQEKEEIILTIKEQYDNMENNIGFIYHNINEQVCRKPINKLFDSLEDVYKLFGIDSKIDKSIKIKISFDLDNNIPLFPTSIKIDAEM